MTPLQRRHARALLTYVLGGFFVVVVFGLIILAWLPR